MREEWGVNNSNDPRFHTVYYLLSLASRVAINRERTVYSVFRRTWRQNWFDPRPERISQWMKRNERNTETEQIWLLILLRDQNQEKAWRWARDEEDGRSCVEKKREEETKKRGKRKQQEEDPQTLQWKEHSSIVIHSKEEGDETGRIRGRRLEFRNQKQQKDDEGKEEEDIHTKHEFLKPLLLLLLGYPRFLPLTLWLWLWIQVKRSRQNAINEREEEEESRVSSSHSGSSLSFEEEESGVYCTQDSSLSQELIQEEENVSLSLIIPAHYAKPRKEDGLPFTFFSSPSLLLLLFSFFFFFSPSERLSCLKCRESQTERLLFISVKKKKRNLLKKHLVEICLTFGNMLISLLFSSSWKRQVEFKDILPSLSTV